MRRLDRVRSCRRSHFARPLVALLLLCSCGGHEDREPAAPSDTSPRFACGRLTPHLALGCNESTSSEESAPSRTTRLDATITLVEGAPVAAERLTDQCALPVETRCPLSGETLAASYEASCASLVDEPSGHLHRVTLRGFGTNVAAPAISGGSGSGLSPEWVGVVTLPLAAKLHRVTLRASAQSHVVGCTLRVGSAPAMPFVRDQETVVSTVLSPGGSVDLVLDCVTPSAPGWIGLACFGGCPIPSGDPSPHAYDATMVLTTEIVPCEGPC